MTTTATVFFEGIGTVQYDGTFITVQTESGSYTFREDAIQHGIVEEFGLERAFIAILDAALARLSLV